MPVHFTNDTKISLQIRLSFNKEYSYSVSDENEKFRIIPMPNEWVEDGRDITEIMTKELANYINNPTIDIRLEAGEEFLLGLGAIYPKPPVLSGVLPKKLFTENQNSNFENCDRTVKTNKNSVDEFGLNLQLSLGEHCLIIPSGHYSYKESK